MLKDFLKNFFLVAFLAVLMAGVALNLCDQRKIRRLEEELATVRVDTVRVPAPPETVVVVSTDSIIVYPDTATGGLILEDHLDTSYFGLDTKVFTIPPRFEYRYAMKPLEITIRINKEVTCEVVPEIPSAVLVSRAPLPPRPAWLSLTFGAAYVAQQPTAILGAKIKTLGVQAMATPGSIGVGITYDFKIF